MRSILAAGAGTPTPRQAGDALVIDLPVAASRSLEEYAPTALAANPIGAMSGTQTHPDTTADTSQAVSS